LCGLVLLMLLVALTESVGLLLLVPVAEVVMSGAGSDNPVIGLMLSALGWIGVPVTLPGLMLTFLVLVAAREYLRYWRDMSITALRFRAVDWHRKHTLDALLRAQWNHVAHHGHAEYANALVTDVNRIGHGLNLVLNMLALLVQLALGLLAALALSWTMTLVALMLGAALVGMMGRIRRRALALGGDVSQSNVILQGAVLETLAGLKLAKLLGQESRFLQRFSERLSVLRQQQLQFQSGASATQSLMHVGGAILLVLFLLGGLQLGQVPLSELAVLSLILARMLPLFSALQQQQLQCFHTLPFIQNLLGLQDKLARVMEPACSIPPPTPKREIRVEHVSYTHDGRREPALCDVSLVLAAGTVTALVGSSGSGKSTLADILSGLLIPQAGRILLDGVPLKAGQHSGWRKQVACVPQDPFLFNDTVRQNLLWARPDADEVQMITALQRAAADFVLELPRGLDACVGERGLMLSGGERQRIALARALLCQPTLLILDECTSAVDEQSEIRIADAVKNLRGSQTLLLIAHRGALLPLADQVITLERGRIGGIEEGEPSAARLYVGEI